MLKIFTTALTWLISQAQLKVIFIGFLTVAMGTLVSIVIQYLQPYLTTSALSNAISSVPSSVWYFADIAELQSGFTIIIGAYITRFLIRRIPFIG